jgi:hypothetical protein
LSPRRDCPSSPRSRKAWPGSGGGTRSESPTRRPRTCSRTASGASTRGAQGTPDHCFFGYTTLRDDGVVCRRLRLRTRDCRPLARRRAVCHLAAGRRRVRSDTSGHLGRRGRRGTRPSAFLRRTYLGIQRGVPPHRSHLAPPSSLRF